VSNFSKHFKSCKIRLQIEKEKEEIYKILIIQMEEQKKEINNLKQQINVNINNTNNSHNTTNSHNNIINNNINIVAFGHENLYALKDDLCKQVLSKGYQCVPILIENTHFNKNKPEYHNVYIPNMKDLYAMIYDGKRWGLKEKSDVVNQLFDDKQCFLIEKFNEFKDDLDPITIKKFGRFLNQSDDEIYSNIKKDIKLLLYNKRDIPMKTRKLMNNQNLEQIK
jgi:hypothetical protein